MYYSGIDLHKDNSFITTIKDDGSIVKQSKISNDPEKIVEYFTSLSGEHKAVVESTAGWYWISDLLEAKGIEIFLAHAKYLKAISYAKVKTDKIDSQTLASLLRMQLIPLAHKIGSQLRGMRDLMRARLKLVSKRTACYNSIHRIGEKFNCDGDITLTDHTIPQCLADTYQFHMRCLYDQIDLLNKQIKEIERMLQPNLIPNEDIQRLLWVPAIGIISAFTIYLEIDGIGRFPTDKQFLSYARLVPGASNSNTTRRHKSGNKDGNKYLKIAFTDAAVHAVRYYSEIRKFYQKKLRKTNQAVARTIVAKELARIVYHILKNKTDYRGFKGQPQSRVKSNNWPRLASPVFGLATS